MLIAGVWWLSGHHGSDWWWLSAGLVSGVLLWWLDRWRGGHYAQHWLQVSEPILISRSLVTLGVVAGLTFYLMTSTGSLLGIGVCIALMIQAAVEMSHYRLQPDQFKARFLWQVKVKEWSPAIQNRLIYSFYFLTALLVALLWV